MDLKTLPLFDQQSTVETVYSDKLERAWKECRRKNPWLMPKLAEIALDMKRAGYECWSTKGLFEVFRWQTRHDMRDLGFKANNNHTALAARDLMKEYPELAGFFRTRQRRPCGNWGQIH